MSWLSILTPIVGVAFGQCVLAIQMQQRGAGARTVLRCYRRSINQAASIIMVDLVSGCLLVALVALVGAVAVTTSAESVDIQGVVDNPVTWGTLGLAVPWFAGSIFSVGVIDRVARQIYAWPAFAAILGAKGAPESGSFMGGPSPKSVRDQAVRAILKTTSIEGVETLSHATLEEYPRIRGRLRDRPDQRLLFVIACVEYCSLSDVIIPEWVTRDVLPPLESLTVSEVAEIRRIGAEPFEVDMDQCCRLLMWMIVERHWEFVGRWTPEPSATDRG